VKNMAKKSTKKKSVEPAIEPEEKKTILPALPPTPPEPEKPKQAKAPKAKVQRAAFDFEAVAAMITQRAAGASDLMTILNARREVLKELGITEAEYIQEMKRR
jgi:hypothetical protein